MAGPAFWCRREDGDALLRRSSGWSANRELRAAMSAHNRTVAQRFSIAATAGEYESLFSRIGRAEAAGAVRDCVSAASAVVQREPDLPAGRARSAADRGERARRSR